MQNTNDKMISFQISISHSMSLHVSPHLDLANRHKKIGPDRILKRVGRLCRSLQTILVLKQIYTTLLLKSVITFIHHTVVRSIIVRNVTYWDRREMYRLMSDNNFKICQQYHYLSWNVLIRSNSNPGHYKAVRMCQAACTEARVDCDDNKCTYLTISQSDKSEMS